jgi:hypothetical protein
LKNKDARAQYDATSAGWRADDSEPTDFAKTFNSRQFFTDFDKELKQHFAGVRERALDGLDGETRAIHAEHMDRHMKAHMDAVRSMHQEVHSIDVAELFADDFVDPFLDPRVGRESDQL